MANCSHCGRVVWDGGGPITIAECTGWKSDRCELVRQRNVMAVLLANIIRDPQNQQLIEEAKSVLGDTSTGVVDHRCQKCFAPYVVDAGGRIRTHYARVTDKTPCLWKGGAP